jgi:hypothetical protein
MGTSNHISEKKRPKGRAPRRKYPRRRPTFQRVMSEMRPMAGSLKASTTRAIQTTAPARIGRSSAMSVRNLKKSRDAADSTRLTVWSPDA